MHYKDKISLGKLVKEEARRRLLQDFGSHIHEVDRSIAAKIEDAYRELVSWEYSRLEKVRRIDEPIEPTDLCNYIQGYSEVVRRRLITAAEFGFEHSASGRLGMKSPYSSTDAKDAEIIRLRKQIESLNAINAELKPNSDHFE